MAMRIISYSLLHLDAPAAPCHLLSTPTIGATETENTMNRLDQIEANCAAVKAVLHSARHDDVIDVGHYPEPTAQLCGAPLPGATFKAAPSLEYPVQWALQIGVVAVCGVLTTSECEAIPEAAAVLAGGAS